MDTDFRKQFESPGSVHTAGSIASTGISPSAIPAVNEEEDPTSITFPLNWLARILQYGFLACMFGFVAHTALYGDPEQDLAKILLGCGGVLLVLVFIPSSIVLDRKGIHQSFLLGLYIYSIAKKDILSYEETTWAELRREGRLWFSWHNPFRQDREGEYEQVVIVNGRYGGRYILHRMMHSGHYRFIEELEKRGVPSRGYEGWSQFMADRGFPPPECEKQ